MEEDGFILVTGGAGYVGTHVLVELIHAGFKTISLDCRGDSIAESQKAIEEITGHKPLGYTVDLLDKNSLEEVFKKHKIRYVLHLAGLKAVRESHNSPLIYYSVNVIGTINLLEVMAEHKVFNIVFSSSSKVYGIPQYLPLDENHPTGQCTNPYGKTKYMVEQILQDLTTADKYGIVGNGENASNLGFYLRVFKYQNYVVKSQPFMRWNVIVLRYFNPCGAHSSGKLGETRIGPPKNLMPCVCFAAMGKLNKLTIFGHDYATPDGTAIKDYTHVVDLAKGHVAAIKTPPNGKNFRVYNLGTGKTYSILDMVKTFEKVSGRKIEVEMCDRKLGEIGECSADSRKANKELQWKAEKSLEQMCEDMWRWVTKDQFMPDD